MSPTHRVKQLLRGSGAPVSEQFREEQQAVAVKDEVVDRPPRTLTDADIDAIVDAMRNKFYRELGKGVWSHLWKLIVTGLIGLLIYGHYRG